MFYLFVCLFSAICLVQKERAGRENFLVWIFLYNENLAVELCKHLTVKSLISWHLAVQLLMLAGVLPNCNQNNDE